MMQKKDKRWQLINYSLVKKQTVTLFSSNEEKILSFDYSKEQQLIAISTIHQNNQRLLKLLKPNGVLVSNHVIQFPQGFSKFKFIHPTFDDSNKQLVFSSVRELFTLSYEGIVTKVPLPLDSKIESPHFHPDGSRLLLIKMSYDSDIALLPLNTLANDSAMKAEDLVKSTRTIARSNVAEENALFNPQDNSIAFVSDRSGQDQLWITHNNQTKLVSSLPHNTLIRGIDWASDGQSVLVNASGTLTLLKLDNTDKKQKEIAFEHPVIQLFQWDNENNTALMNVNIKGVSGLIELNLTDLSYRHIATKKAVWAQKGIDGKIIYSDKRDRFWMFKPIENQLISPLVGKQVNVRFVLKDNVIYGVNKAKELLQYNINTQILSKLAQLDENIDYLTDINENQALFELTISGKKEVVELANQSSRL